LLQEFKNNFAKPIKTENMNLKEFLAATDYLKFDQRSGKFQSDNKKRESLNAGQPTPSTSSNTNAKPPARTPDVSHLLNTNAKPNQSNHPAFSRYSQLSSPLSSQQHQQAPQPQQQSQSNTTSDKSRPQTHSAKENKMLFWDEQYRMVLEALKSSRYDPTLTCQTLGISTRALSKTILLYVIVN
jgi:hypothetical protein